MAKAFRVYLMIALGFAALALYFFWDNTKLIPFVVSLRLKTMAAMILSGAALGISTVLFYAVSRNRIVTPSSLGLEFFYVFIQTFIIFMFGSIFLFRINQSISFMVGMVLMMAYAMLLYRIFFHRSDGNTFFLLLVGMIVTSLFMSATTMLNVLMDPNEFQVAQDIGFSSFNQVDSFALTVSAILIIPLSVYAFTLAPILDVMSLGRDVAVGLGVEYHRICLRILIVVAALMTASTLLAGPMFFMGLILLNITVHAVNGFRYRDLLPAGAAVGVLILTVGQFIVFHILNFKTELNVIINFMGGVYFFYLIFRENKKCR